MAAADVHEHRSATLTSPSTASTWAPHPAQDGFEHWRQTTLLHIPPRVSAPEGRLAHRAASTREIEVPDQLEAAQAADAVVLAGGLLWSHPTQTTRVQLVFDTIVVP